MKWKKNKKQKKEKKRRFFKRKTVQEPENLNDQDTNNTQPPDNLQTNPDCVEETQNMIHPDVQENMIETDLQEKPAPKKEKKRVFNRLKERLKKSRKKMGAWGKKRLDDELLEMVEESLITADVGVETSMLIMDTLNEQVKQKMITSTDQLQKTVIDQLMQRLPQKDSSKEAFTYHPHVILVVGVNGVGKTTTIGKLASQLTSQGKKVIIGASDTFRAAAVEQLELWAERSSSDIVRHKENADPAAVAFDTVQAAISRKADVAIIDTAGRLHTKKNLMEEIKKIRRSIAKKLSGAPHDIFLVLDATTGQNAVQQTKLFHESLNVTGIILTKLDGTAKGGIVVSIANTFDIPIKYIGIGENIDDLQIFEPELFVRALIEPE
jgi:fused signal recognition particle receptor